MNKKTEITAYLNNCTTSVADGCAIGTGLTAIHKRIFNCKNNVIKAEMVKNLTEFYAEEKNIINIWKSLNECERDFVSYIVQYKGKEHIQTTLEYAKKHKIAIQYKTIRGYNNNIFDEYNYSHLKFLHILNQHIPGTKTSLLFPSGKDMPSFIFAVLQKIVEPMKYEYNEFIPTKADFVICREHRLGDFAAVVRFAGTEQLKVKAETYDITKSKLVKMSELIGFEEVCDQNGKFCAPKEAKRNNDFKVAPLLFTLAANSKLVDIDYNGDVLPGKQSTTLLMMPLHEFAKKLFTDYAKENSIYELRYIPRITAYNREKWIKWHECRKEIFELLKSCPIETFINFEDFNKYAKIFYGNFFRRMLYYTVMIGGYNFSYDNFRSYDSDWDKCEAQIIRLILSFLSIIGMIDIVYSQNMPRTKNPYNTEFYVGISGFRITKLGAWILGMTNKYEASTTAVMRNEKGELRVLPDYSIVISGLKCRIEHEIYLSRFLTKVSSDENASVYKLDFKSIIRAYDDGITPMKIKKYLKNANNNTLPNNVERSLTDWQAKVGKVKIRELTVLETDDELLLEEIKHIKAMNNIITGDLRHAISLVSTGKKKAKTLIENNGWIVDI
ncbi:MAG: helicase-associated domain-containing protein [Candidatus Bathyarchaeota archaeon]|nr:helicase-associated domain-containing protein [Candidatus Termiticorpusculum sp.]